MPLTSGLAKLASLDVLPVADQGQYNLVHLLDTFFADGHYNPVSQFGLHRTLKSVELIPINEHGWRTKSQIDTDVAVLTADVRRKECEGNFQILKDAGYHLRIEKISIDEWAVSINARQGTITSRFIDA